MSTTVIHLAPKQPEIVIDFPSGATSVFDFPLGAIATRKQIAHLVECAKIVARKDALSTEDTATLVQWAEDFFRPLACAIVFRSQEAADSAREICYAHASVYLHGQYFRAEQIRIEQSPTAIDEAHHRANRS